MNKLMNVEELADFLSLTNQTIYAMMKKNNIPFYRTGKRGNFRFSPEEVLKALSKNSGALTEPNG